MLRVLKGIGLFSAIGLVWCSGVFGQIVTTIPVTWESEPLDIVAGPDGAMWFTDSGDNQIGRIGPQGTVSGYRLSTWSGGGITPGPDGKLWFTEGGLARIASITVDGRLSEFHLPPASVLAWSDRIAAGPDGNIWFTEHDTNQIGRDLDLRPDRRVSPPHRFCRADGHCPGSGRQRLVRRIRRPRHRTNHAVGRHHRVPVADPKPSDRPGFRSGRQHLVRHAEQSGRPNHARRGNHRVPDAGRVPRRRSPTATVSGSSATTRTSGACRPAAPSPHIMPGFRPPPNARGMGVGPDGAIWLTAGDGWDYNGAILRFALDTSACVADATTLCLNQGRFRVTADWKAGDGSTGHGHGVDLTANSGLLLVLRRGQRRDDRQGPRRLRVQPALNGSLRLD